MIMMMMMRRRKRIKKKSFDGEVESNTDLPKAKDQGYFLSYSYSQFPYN